MISILRTSQKGTEVDESPQKELSRGNPNDGSEPNSSKDGSVTGRPEQVSRESTGMMSNYMNNRFTEAIRNVLRNLDLKDEEYGVVSQRSLGLLKVYNSCFPFTINSSSEALNVIAAAVVFVAYCSVPSKRRSNLFTFRKAAKLEAIKMKLLNTKVQIVESVLTSLAKQLPWFPTARNKYVSISRYLPDVLTYQEQLMDDLKKDTRKRCGEGREDDVHELKRMKADILNQVCAQNEKSHHLSKAELKHVVTKELCLLKMKMANTDSASPQ